MDTIYEELHALELKIKAYPPNAHWFCPKIDDDDDTDYTNLDTDEEEASSKEKQIRTSAAVRRQDDVYLFIRVLGLPQDGPQEVAWMEWYTRRLHISLTTCDKCVKAYHTGRARLTTRLREDYDEDTISAMLDILDVFDRNRIEAGLKQGFELLNGLPTKARSLAGLAGTNIEAVQALYEALCCKAYLSFKDHDSILFDSVFEMVQTNKILVIGDLVPAMTQFLFDPEPLRRDFAIKGWTNPKTNQNLTPQLFTWIVQDALLAAIQPLTGALQGAQISISRMNRFWAGVMLVIEKLDEDLIVHSLRAMESATDIYHLAFDHMLIDQPDVLQSIIQVIHLLIEKSSKSFWDAYGSISPSAIAERIFNSPAFLPLLSQAQRDVTDTATNEVNVALAWIPIFIRSLNSNQQYEACRTMLSALLNKYQAGNVKKESKMECLTQGLGAMSTTLRTFVAEDYRVNASTSFITINNVLGLVDCYKSTIVACALLKDKDVNGQLVNVLSLDVIRLSLLLDCKALRAQFVAIQSGQPVHHGHESNSNSLWRAILDALKPDNMLMATDILLGIVPLNGIDHFHRKKHSKTRELTSLSPDEERFEKDFAPMTLMVSEIYERLSEFKPENLQELCEDPRTAAQLFAGLTPTDKPTYDWTVSIIKTVTGAESRKDAISKLLNDSLAPTLTAMFKAVNSAALLKTYAAFPYIIKTGNDTIQSLCDAQDGILRTRMNLTAAEQGAIKTWWRIQWKTLDIAFRSTERWSSTMSSNLMTDFVRDTIDFAESLFDNYSVLASALSNPDRDRSDDAVETSEAICKALLEQPRRSLNEITKWLRLRDQYLVASSSNLVCKVLRRLAQHGVLIDDHAKNYIVDVTSAQTKTVLTGPQKAELTTAFNEHFGIDPDIKPDHKKLRDGVIDLDAWTSKSEHSRSSSLAPDSGDDVAKGLSRQTDSSIGRSVVEQLRANRRATLSKSMKAVAPLKGMSLKESRAKEKNAKLARDAAIVAHAKALRDSNGTNALVKGEGSAISTVGGNYGKEHGPEQSEMMVSSDSESDSDSDSDEDVTSLLIKKKSVKKATAPKLPTYEGPVKKQKIIRSVKDMRARLTPPLEPLHQIILDWDFFHDSDTVPGNDSFRKVADKFLTTQDYNRTFQPLLVSEAWRQFRTAKEDNNAKPFEIMIVNRMSVDSFFEISTSVPMSVARDQGLSEGDIVLLSKGAKPATDYDAPHCLGRVARINRKKDVWEISYRVSGKISREEGLLKGFAPKATMRGLKVTSLTTVEREYGALFSFQYYDLCEEVLSAKPSPLLKYAAADVEKMRSRYEVNPGQAKAIMSVRDNDGFTLIQGPPGSGKTKTIVAMVGALLTESLQQHGQAITRPGAQKNAQIAKVAQKKLLVCAPSNAAVDELVQRLKAGVLTTRGEFRKISVVRLGRSEAVNANVKDVTLDLLVSKAMMAMNGGAPVVSERDKLHQEAGRLKAELAELRPRLDAARAGEDKTLELKLVRQFEIIKRQQNTIGSKIDEDKDKGNTAARDNELNRHRVQQEILDGAHVICSTLSASGHDMFKKLNVEFETVIIDEAAQCIELSALIPLKYGCSKCILVGDPKQLPPTVLSKAATSFGYEQSLFVRMQKNHPDYVHLLDTQYRMHPEISVFPSQQFYDSRLLDGDDMARLRTQPWHASPLLGPYRFFDVKGVQSVGAGGRSIVNMPEIQVALQIYERVKNDYPEIDFKGKIGIITPYKAQLNALKLHFSSRYGAEIIDDIDFNTTDSFQGREAEIIIFSCVRAAATGGIGFMSDIRRMNVGLTRAKSSLWVLGSSDALLQGEFWSKLVRNAQLRQRYTEGDVLRMLKKPITRDELHAFSANPLSNVPVQRITDVTDVQEAPTSMEGIVYSDARDTGTGVRKLSVATKSAKQDIPEEAVKKAAIVMPQPEKKRVAGGFNLLGGGNKKNPPKIKTVAITSGKNENGKRVISSPVNEGSSPQQPESADMHHVDRETLLSSVKVATPDVGNHEKVVAAKLEATKDMAADDSDRMEGVAVLKRRPVIAGLPDRAPAQHPPLKKMKKRPAADPLRRR